MTDDDWGRLFLILMALAGSIAINFVSCQFGKSQVCNQLCIEKKHESGIWHSEKEECLCSDSTVLEKE